MYCVSSTLTLMSCILPPVSSLLFCADRRTGGSAPRRWGGTREGFDRAEEAARARGCWVFFNIFAFCSTNRRGWTLYYPGKGYRVTPPTSLKDKFAYAEFLVLPYSPKSICALKKPNDWFSYASPPGCKTGSSTRTRGELGVKTGTGKNIVIIAMSDPFVEIDIKMRREREMKWQTWAGIIACWWWWPCRRRGLRGSAKPKRGEEVQAN